VTPQRVEIRLDHPRGQDKVDLTRKTTLVGKWLHGPATPGWQGHIVAEPAPQMYLVQLFSWIDGHPTDQKLISLQRMIEENWTFYDSSEDMIFAYEYGGLKERWQDERKERDQA